MPTLKIQRLNDANNASRIFKIFVNKTEMGTIANGETKEFTLPEGQNDVILRNSWMKSPKYSFYLRDNETKTYEAAAHKNAKWVVVLIIGLLVLRIGFRVILRYTLGAQYYSSSSALVFTFVLLAIYLYVRRVSSFLTLTEVPS